MYSKINELVQYILDNTENLFDGNGEYICEEEFNWAEKITDTKLNHFYIRSTRKPTVINLDDYSCRKVYEKTFYLRLIAKFKKNEGQLKYVFDKMNTDDVLIRSFDDNSLRIYKEETGQDLMNDEFYVIEIDFELVDN